MTSYFGGTSALGFQNIGARSSGETWFRIGCKPSQVSGDGEFPGRLLGYLGVYAYDGGFDPFENFAVLWRQIPIYGTAAGITVEGLPSNLTYFWGVEWKVPLLDWIAYAGPDDLFKPGATSY